MLYKKWLDTGYGEIIMNPEYKENALNIENFKWNKNPFVYDAIHNNVCNINNDIFTNYEKDINEGKDNTFVNVLTDNEDTMIVPVNKEDLENILPFTIYPYDYVKVDFNVPYKNRSYNLSVFYNTDDEVFITCKCYEILVNCKGEDVYNAIYLAIRNLNAKIVRKRN